MVYLVFYLTPIIAILFFVNGVALAKKIKNGEENTANNTAWGAIMFGYIIFALLFAGFVS